MEYITTNSSCDSGDPATNTMAYYYPPGLNPFLVDDKDSLSLAGSNDTAVLPPPNFSPRTPPQQIATVCPTSSFRPSGQMLQWPGLAQQRVSSSYAE